MSSCLEGIELHLRRRERGDVVKKDGCSLVLVALVGF